VSTRAYIRVSSKSQNYDTQRSAIERAVMARKDVIDVWYAEKKSVTKSKLSERPELQRLRDDARAGHVRKVYVFRIDRLTRTGIKDTLGLIEELEGHGVELVTITDGFDLNGPARDVVIACLSWAAKMESLALAERVAAARERIEGEGGRWGRPRRVDPELGARAAELHAQGRSIRSIAMALRTPRSTVARALAELTLSQKANLDPSP
jgi:DNA invertase Pin-like site-specific DNA recombinase